jgi:NADH dehydrogenase (ubiquinone) 1 alpha subcomplex subunit 5
VERVGLPGSDNFRGQLYTSPPLRILMLRLTRPLFQQVLKKTTGVTGLAVHPNPLPELSKTYESTLTLLSSIPSTSVYRQGVEALTQRKLTIIRGANGDVAEVEKQLDEGHIEESLDIANDELKLVSNMIEWKAYVLFLQLVSNTILTFVTSWEPLEENPEPGQWEYFGQPTSTSTVHPR